MKVYISIMSGNYRHEIVGAHTSFEVAKTFSKEIIKDQKDDYHQVGVIKINLNGDFNLNTKYGDYENLIGQWKREDRNYIIGANKEPEGMVLNWVDYE